MSSSSSSSDTLLLLETAHFAAIAHAKQVRKNHARTPYINHPLDVARRIAAPGSTLSPSPPVHILQAAMLHDVVEDTEYTADDIEARFGKRVRDIVMECSDDPSLNKAARKQAQIDHAPHKSWDAKHVKLADKLSNLTDLSSPGGVPIGWTRERVEEYFQWGKRVTDAIGKDANPGLSEQLEELYTKATFEFGGKTWKALPGYEEK
ncbi:HD domain-containing protein 3 [Leucosporidium creatinivorum]|uniref:HD domain-containing protein 3 n=1 Tax=Leucosporidium creatinivorum TaxID=106004 RepID=A0A1Y2EV35_9BASI|nr:HD domain-containing protein 3 [Leucosporidium creatinivorum]